MVYSLLNGTLLFLDKEIQFLTTLLKISRPFVLIFSFLFSIYFRISCNNCTRANFLSQFIAILHILRDLRYLLYVT